MRKVVTCLSARQNESREAFQSWALHDLAPRLVQVAGVQKLTINLAVDTPAFLSVPPVNPSAPSPYEVVVMTWMEDEASLPADHFPTSRAARVHSYMVEEIVEKAEIPIVQGTITPGIKNLPLIVCQDQHDAPSRRNKWHMHGLLGLRLHTGMKRYVRNIVIENLTPSEGPRIDGIGEVGFPSLHDLQFGLFPKPEDRTAFLEDVASWVKASTVQYAMEHVIKW